MKKYLLIGIFFAINTIVACSAFADNSPQQPNFLTGKILIVDMDNDGKVSKTTVLNGTDLLLATINNDKSHKTPAFNIETINDVATLTPFDKNHDGSIEQDELAKSNIVLIRLSSDRSITIIPLALSNIKEIHYQGGLTQKNKVNQPLDVWLTDVNGKKYQTYYLNF